MLHNPIISLLQKRAERRVEGEEADDTQNDGGLDDIWSKSQEP